MTARVIRSDPDCQPANPKNTSTAPAATAASSRRVAGDPRSSSMSPLRSNPSGRTRRRGSSGKTADNNETSPPVSAPCTAAAGVSRAATCRPPTSTSGMNSWSAAAPAAMPKALASPASTAICRSAISRMVREDTPRQRSMAADGRLWRVKARATLKTPMPPSSRITKPARLR